MYLFTSEYISNHVIDFHDFEIESLFNSIEIKINSNFIQWILVILLIPLNIIVVPIGISFFIINNLMSLIITITVIYPIQMVLELLYMFDKWLMKPTIHPNIVSITKGV